MKDLIERLRKGRNYISGDDCDRIADALEDALAEIARHHKDFERWEAMADKGAQQVAKLAAVDELHHADEFGMWCCACEGSWPCSTHRILHPAA